MIVIRDLLDRVRAMARSRDAATMGPDGWGNARDPLVLELSATARSGDALVARRIDGSAATILAAYRDAFSARPVEPAAAAAGTMAGAPPAPRPNLLRRRSPRADLAPVRWRSARVRAAVAVPAAALALTLAALAAAASAPPASPMYGVRMAWEEALLPAAPDSRLAAEVARLERRLGEAETASAVDDWPASRAALVAYASIARAAAFVAPVDDTTRAALLERLAAQIAALERLGASTPVVDVGDAVRAATALELRLRSRSGEGGGTGAGTGAGGSGDHAGAGPGNGGAGGAGAGGAGGAGSGGAGAGGPSAEAGAGGGPGGTGAAGNGGTGAGSGGAGGGTGPGGAAAPTSGPGSGNGEAGSGGSGGGTGAGGAGGAGGPGAGDAGGPGVGGSGAGTGSGSETGQAPPGPAPTATPSPSPGPTSTAPLPVKPGGSGDAANGGHHGGQ